MPLLSIKCYIWLEQCGKSNLKFIPWWIWETHKNRIYNINYIRRSSFEDERKEKRVPLAHTFDITDRKMSAYEQFITRKKNHTHATLVSIDREKKGERRWNGWNVWLSRWRERRKKERKKMPSQPQVIKYANWTEHLVRSIVISKPCPFRYQRVITDSSFWFQYCWFFQIELTAQAEASHASFDSWNARHLIYLRVSLWIVSKHLDYTWCGWCFSLFFCI